MNSALSAGPDHLAAAEDWETKGYVSPVPIVSGDEAARHRATLEAAEREQGSLHYIPKMHMVMRSPYELATHPSVLDVVEALIGPNILLYNTEYIIKEPQTPSFVSWHQDLTYWGLSDDAQVSLWLALSPATDFSGCMRMLPGSHKKGVFAHHTSDDASNVLNQSQTVHGIDEDEAVLCPLKPGEASFHHGWVLHASMPNRSDDRRIGLNAQFLAPHVRQTKHDRDTAILVRGEDRYGHFGQDPIATEDWNPAQARLWRELSALQTETQSTS